MARPFLTAEWRHLLMLTYDLPAELLAPHVPAGTELDTFEGRTLASIVGFQFLRTRLFGVPVPWHGSFEEVNLRFYIRQRHDDAWRHGVVFIRELVPRWAVAQVANRVYDEHYAVLPMRHAIDLHWGNRGEVGSVRYEWRHAGQWYGMSVRVTGEAELPAAESIEDFLTENYWGFTALPEGRCREFRVEHVPWRVWPASDVTFTCPIAALYGAEWVEPLSREPCSALVADGSAVAMFRGD